MLESLRQSLTDGQQTVPILFYQNSEASAEIFRENAIEATFSVNDGDSNSRLDIFSVVYALNGTVLGEYASDSGFLQICLLEESLASKAYRFGTYFYKICKTDFDFASGSQRQKSQSPEESAATEFIEIFIRYRAIDGRIMVCGFFYKMQQDQMCD
jgi:hypothetical protein